MHGPDSPKAVRRRCASRHDTGYANGFWVRHTLVMNIFHRALAVAFLAAVPAAAQSAGDPCTDGTPRICSNSTTLLACENGAYTEVNCPDAVAGSECAELPCSGPDCPEDAACIGQRGNDCIGVGVLFNADTSDDELLMAVPCEGTDVCLTSTSSETCVARPAGVTNCTGFATNCVGDLLTICVGFSESAFLSSPGVMDCGAAGLTCGTDPATGNPNCIEPADARCGAEGFGACINNVANFCSNGTFTGSTTDCSNSGQACVDSGGTPRCVTASPECGPTGVGVCDGNTATICADAQVVNTTDCAAIGRRCGADATGQIACITGGGGEGEGEREPECDSDSDCEDDETCDDGECRRERSRGTGDEEAPAAGLFGCNSTGGVVFPMTAAMALLLRRRRRA